MGLASTHFDPIVGVDVHIIQPAGPVPPVPVPHPYTGMIFDPMDYAPWIGATVLVGGMRRAQAGTEGKTIPSHIPIGGTFIKPPGNESEVFMGSASVAADGDAFTYGGLPALSCQDVGMVAPFRAKKPRKTTSMVLPTSVCVPVPKGPPVLVGGAPTVSLIALGMRGAFAALGKLGKYVKKTATFKKLASKAKNTKAFKKYKGAMKKLENAKQKVNCFVFGEPIDVITGANVDDFPDARLPGRGGAPDLEWCRWYDSRWRDEPGPLGPGFRHTFHRRLLLTDDGFEYHGPDGEGAALPAFGDRDPLVRAGGFALQRPAGRIYRLESSEGETMEFVLGEDRRTASLSRLENGTAVFELGYDARGFLESIRTDAERVLRIESGPQGLITGLVLEEGREPPQRLAGYAYDAAGRLVLWRDALGHESRYEYDARNLMTRKTDRNGYSYHYRYDEAGRCIHTWGDDGLYDVAFEYRAAARQTITRFADGATWISYYDDSGLMSEVVDPVGGSLKYNKDEDGRVVEQVDSGGNTTRFEYDALGRHTHRVDPLGFEQPPLHIEPNPPNPLLTPTPNTPLEWEHGALLPASEIRPAAAAASSFADLPDLEDGLAAGGGNAAAGAEPPAERRDAMGRLLERRDVRGSERWEYDPNGNETRYTDRDGCERRRVYASWNLIQQQIDGEGNATHYEYSAREQITRVIDPGGTSHEYGYDAADELIEVRRHGKVRERYLYDLCGNVVEKVDGAGASIARYQPGPGGLDLARELVSGGRHSYEYDDRGRFLAVATDDFRVEFEYDRHDRFLKDLRDGRGVTYRFLDNRLAEITLLDRFTVRYEHEKDSTTLTDPTGARHRIERIPGRGWLARRLANGTTEVSSYQEDGRCAAKVRYRPGAGERQEPVHGERYRYSGQGDLLAVENGEGTTRFGYDRAHRLCQQIDPDGSEHVFSHDAAGNLTRKPGLERVSLQSGNRLAEANGDRFEYDARDHVCERSGSGGATRYAYDSNDMLVRIESDGTEWSAEYDPLGRRVRKRWGERSVEFFWDDDRLAGELHEDGRLRQYIYGDEKALVPLLFVEYPSADAPPESGESYAIFTNSLGAPVRVEDARGHAVWQARMNPWGDVEVDPGSRVEMPLRFPGHYHDAETGLHNNRFRYYAPELGRYLQSDPMGIGGGQNLYAYPGNPLTTVDLDGLHGKSYGKPKVGSKKTPKTEELYPPGGDLPVPSKKALDDSGMDPVHFKNGQQHAKDTKQVVIVRNSNPNSKKWQGSPDARPKPLDVKMKTAKSGEHAGLVQAPSVPRPKDTTTKPPDWDQKDWDNYQDLRDKGWDVDEDGLLRDPDGKVIHGDYDLQGAYGKPDGAPDWQAPDTNADDFQKKVNDEVCPGEDMFQHGANDDYMPDGRPPAGDPGRFPDDDEGYTVFMPDGSSKSFESTEDLQKFYESEGIDWPYGDYPKGGSGA